jgi:hypothetical protein
VDSADTRRESLWAALGFLVLACVLLGPAVWGGRVLFQRDISMWWYPQVEAFVRAVAGGAWPVWNPDRGFGQPLLADPSAQVLYPFTWLNLVLRPWTYYTFFVVMHLAGSAFGLYRLARGWGLAPRAAWTGGAVWMAGGPFLSLTSMIHHFGSAAWIPWVFFAVDRVAQKPAASRAVVLGIVLAGQILPGSADMVAMTWLCAAFYALVRHMSWSDWKGVSNRRLVVLAAGAALLSLTLSAAQWMPTLDVTRRAARWNLPQGDRITWSLHPLSLLQTGLRFRWTELPLSPQSVTAILDDREPWLPSIYLGLPTLVLLAAALAAPGRAPHRPFAALALIAVLVSLGPYVGIYDALVWLIPPLRILRYPMKAMVPGSFAVAVLAAMGVDAWARLGGARRGRAIVLAVTLLLLGLAVWALWTAQGAAAGNALTPLLARTTWMSDALAATARTLTLSVALAAAAVAIAALAGRRPERGAAFGVILGGLAVFDLTAVHRHLNPTAPRELFAHRPPALALLDPPPARRLYAYDYSMVTRAQRERQPHIAAVYRLARQPVGWGRAESLVLGAHLYLNPPTAGRWGVAGSYDLDMLRLYPAPLSRLVELLRDVEGTPLHLRLLQMGAVTNVAALEPAEWWKDLTPVGEDPGLFERPIRIFRVPAPRPRAYAVTRARIADGDAALAVLRDPAFDPAREVLLAEGDTTSLPAVEAPAISDASLSPGDCRIVDARPDRVQIDADLTAPGYVVLVQSHDPGWKVTVDGRAATTRRANIAFCAVEVPAGRHHIEWVYRPGSLIAGLWLSGVSMAAAAAVCGATRAKAS